MPICRALKCYDDECYRLVLVVACPVTRSALRRAVVACGVPRLQGTAPKGAIERLLSLSIIHRTYSRASRL